MPNFNENYLRENSYEQLLAADYQNLVSSIDQNVQEAELALDKAGLPNPLALAAVFDNIAFPLRELRELNEEIIRDLVYLKLAMVELEPRHAHLMPAELSGGMIKRVALARALSLEPELLVLDEPTAGLDPDLADNFVKLIRMLQKELGFTVVMVTHDLDTLAGLASRVAVLAEQRIVACGTPAEVLAVDHPFVRDFFCSEHAIAVMQKGVV